MNPIVIARTGNSGAVETNTTAIPTASERNVNRELSAIDPSSKPCSRFHLMPQLRQRWWRPNHRRMKVRRDPHSGHFSTAARRNITSAPGTEEFTSPAY